ALHDEPVGGDPLVWPDHDEVADAEGFDGDLALDRAAPRPTIATDAGGLRGDLREGFDGAAGAAHRVVFERMPEREEEEQQRPLEPLPKGGGPGRGHEHEEVDL